MADHGVEGVDGPVGEHGRGAAHCRPDRGGDDGVDGVLGHRFHHGPDDLGLVEAGRIAAHQGRQREPGPPARSPAVKRLADLTGCTGQRPPATAR